MRVDDRCIPVMGDAGGRDAAVPLDGAVPDGAVAPDAGPAECRGDGDCSDLEPACVMGFCRSCTETACSESLKLRQFLAVVCLASARREGDGPLVDAFETLYCGGPPALVSVFAALERASAAGRFTIDETAFANCDDSFGLATLDDSPCSAALVGTGAAGAACQFDFECAAGFCDVPLGTCNGVCTPPGAASAPCTSDGQCAAGLLCLSDACEVPPASGDACTTRCAEGLFCNAAMRCEARHTAGGACGSPGLGGDCVDGLACREGICVVAPAEGDVCWPATFDVRCAEGLRCDGESCRAPRAMGADCTTTTQCPYGSRCHDGACATIIALGAECSTGDPCALGTACNDSRCSHLPDVGSACDETVAPACVRGVCTGGTCTNLAAGAACVGGPIAFDVLDPCGSESSCDDARCEAEGDVGDPCVGSSDCRAPALVCDATSACAEACPLL